MRKFMHVRLAKLRLNRQDSLGPCFIKVGSYFPIGVAGSFDIPWGNGLARLCKSSRKELQAITFRAAYQNT
jgi:hypothetical protein